MCEVVVSSDEVEQTLAETAAEEMMAVEGSGRRLEGLMQWERFLPKIALRVLLVEADDSTRQIIGALLRKCSYRVAALSDGLKAWELLKGRPHNIDLILTEVDLPSISGYALLTLIMEHEICKNIPVIMMSSQDSVSTVYKCMLRGAADYLVKPLRRNELRNLWQHVWRRQSSLANWNSPQNESVGQQKFEAASENNSASNQASGIKSNKEQIEKGSEAQSSCTKPDMEAETRDVENTHNLLQKTYKESLSSQAMGGAWDDGSPTIVNEDVEPERQVKATGNIFKEAIDFMGAFRSNGCIKNDRTSWVDSVLELDLSLKRSTSGLENLYSGEKSILRPSSASAFTRYVNRPIQTQVLVSPNMCNEKKEVGSNNDKVSSKAAGYCNSDSPGPPNIPRRESAKSWFHQSSYFSPVPVKGIRLDSHSTPEAVYGLGTPPIFVAQSNPPPTPSRSSTSPQELSSSLRPFRMSTLENDKFGHLHNQLDSKNTLEHKLDAMEDKAHVSPTIDGSCKGMFFGCTSGNNNNVDHQVVGVDVGADAENKNEDGFSSPTGKSQRSLQREAALTKFRMKRKDRCFEKKVRYESRKKLAEQRPRVKGQFVRQVNLESVAAAEVPTVTQDNWGNP